MREKTMTMGTSFCRRTALATAAMLVSSLAIADDVTFNVPVQVTSLAQGVTKGRVHCSVTGKWKGSIGWGRRQFLRRSERLPKGEFWVTI